VGPEQFAIEIQRVQEIIRHQALTHVPNSPSFVEGVINLRGHVIPVIALRKRLGFDHQPDAGQERIVILEAKHMVFGFMVDSVPQVLRIPVRSIVDPPRIFEARREYVTGVAKVENGLIILLDIEAVLESCDAGAPTPAAQG
jgi:purine-binding chemotaxis protein CheW